MFISLAIIFFLCLSLSYIEERLEKRDKVILYSALGLAMILIAGLREVGYTPDSDAYEEMFYAKNETITSELVEPTFTLFSNTLQSLNLGITALFLTYAIISIPLRLTAIWKLSSLPILTLSIYISYYYQLHDVVQMRCAVASALFLLALYYRLQHKVTISLLCIATGFFFHFSAIIGLIIFLIDSKPLKSWQIAILYAIIPIGIIYSFSGLDISQFVPSAIGGDKLQLYRELKEKGIEGDMEGLPFYKDPAILLNICLYYGCVFFNRILSEKNQFFPIFLKIMGVAFICKFLFGSLSSVLASRLFEYFDVVSIFLWTSVVYVVLPIWFGKTIVNAITTVRFTLSSLIYVLGLGLH